MGKSLCAPMQVGAVTLALAICMLTSSLQIYGASAQDCNTALLTLQPCLPYIQPGNTTNPGTQCCTPLGSLLTSNATCLCQLPSLAQQVSMTINQTRALEIAALCKQTVPASVTNCLSSIAPAPSGSVPISGGPPTTTTPNNSNTTPAENNAGIISPMSLLLGSILVAFPMYLSMHT